MDGNHYGDQQRRGRGGYNNGSNNGYPAQRGGYGGYPQQPPGPYGHPMQGMPPQSYPYPAGGYGGQQGGYPGQQGAYQQGYAPRGGYGQQPMYGQQPYGMQPGYNMPYGQGRPPFGSGYGRGMPHQGGPGGGRGRGAPGRGGFHSGPGQRGGGGRGGGFGARPPRQEQLCLVHVDSFATLFTASRSGSITSLVPQWALGQNRYGGGSILRVLVIVGKQYLAAAMSEPRESQDIVLSEATATKFMNVENALCDEGQLLINLESGDKLAKNLYVQLRHSLLQIVAFDKEAGGEDAAAPVDIYDTNPETLLTSMGAKKSLFQQLEVAMSEDSERSATLFDQLLRVSSPSLTAGSDEKGKENESDNEMDGEAHSPAPSAANNGTASSSTATPARRTHVLLRTPQGVRLLSLALEVPSKRQLFFQRVEEEGQEVIRTRTSATHTAPDGTLFLTLLSSVLAVPLVLHSFGVPITLHGVEAPVPVWADRNRIVDILCARTAEEGILLIRSNGGSCMITGLVKRLRPTYKTDEAPRSERRVGGFKRGRQGDNEPSGRSVRTEGGAVRAETQETLSHPKAPATLNAFEVPVAPLDWRFFHACAAAFTEGRVPERIASKEVGTTTLVKEDIKEERIPLITDHIISCRAVQCLLPHFADTVLTYEKERLYNNSTAETPFVRHCTAFLEGLAQRAKDLMMHQFGNYVAQQLITTLVSRAIPTSRIHAMMERIMSTVVDNIAELSAEKFASNVVERAILTSETLPSGPQFIVRAVAALLKSDDRTLASLGSGPYGNYIVALLCKKITALVLGGVGSTTVPDAASVEKELFQRLNRQMQVLQLNPRFTAGLMTWMGGQHERLKDA